MNAPNPDLADMLALAMTMGFMAGTGALLTQTFFLFRDMQPPIPGRWSIVVFLFVVGVLYLGLVVGDYPSVMAALTNREQDAEWTTVARGYAGAQILWLAVGVLHVGYRHILTLQEQVRRYVARHGIL